MGSNFEIRVPSLIESELNKLEKVFHSARTEFLLIGLNQSQSNAVVKMIKFFLSECQNSIDFLMKQTKTQPEKIIADIFGQSTSILDSMDSHYKRLIFYLSK